jgi:hypothetical protein
MQGGGAFQVLLFGNWAATSWAARHPRRKILWRLTRPDLSPGVAPSDRQVKFGPKRPLARDAFQGIAGSKYTPPFTIALFDSRLVAAACARAQLVGIMHRRWALPGAPRVKILPIRLFTALVVRVPRTNLFHRLRRLGCWRDLWDNLNFPMQAIDIT